MDRTGAGTCSFLPISPREVSVLCGGVVDNPASMERRVDGDRDGGGSGQGAREKKRGKLRRISKQLTSYRLVNAGRQTADGCVVLPKEPSLRPVLVCWWDKPAGRGWRHRLKAAREVLNANARRVDQGERDVNWCSDRLR